MYRNLKNFFDTQFRLSPLAFLVFTPFSIAAVPLAFSFRANSPTVWILLLLGSAITFLTSIFFLFLLSWLSKVKTGNSTVLNLLALILTGLFRGFIFFYFMEFSAIQNPSPLLGRLLNSTYSVVLWIGLASILIESNRSFKRRYGALLTQLLISKLSSSNAPDPGYALIAQQIARMQLKIRKIIQDRELDQSDSNHAVILGAALREEIEVNLKPLSQRLWVKSLFTPPSAKIAGVISSAITELQYPYIFTATLYGCSNIINATQSLGFFAGVVYGTSTFFVLYIFEKARQSLVAHFTSNSSYINRFFVVFIGFAVLLTTNGIFQVVGIDYSFMVALLTAPVLSFLIIAVAGVKLILHDRRTILDILSRKILKVDNERLDSVLSGNAASYLHNSLQSELNALALQLDAIVQNPDPAQNKILMKRIDALVSQSRSEDFKLFFETPQVRLGRVIASWNGIADIDLAIDTGIWDDGIRSSIVASLVQEAIANSVRAGEASRVNVSGEISGDSIVITVLDNGTAPLLAERRGIGSQWIDRIATTEWKVEQTAKGRLLRVEI